MVLARISADGMASGASAWSYLDGMASGILAWIFLDGIASFFFAWISLDGMASDIFAWISSDRMAEGRHTACKSGWNSYGPREDPTIEPQGSQIAFPAPLL